MQTSLAFLAAVVTALGWLVTHALQVRVSDPEAFAEAPRDTGPAAGLPGGSHIRCYVAWFWGMPYIACEIYIAF